MVFVTVVVIVSSSLSTVLDSVARASEDTATSLSLFSAGGGAGTTATSSSSSSKSIARLSRAAPRENPAFFLGASSTSFAFSSTTTDEDSVAIFIVVVSVVSVVSVVFVVVDASAGSVDSVFVAEKPKKPKKPPPAAGDSGFSGSFATTCSLSSSFATAGDSISTASIAAAASDPLTSSLSMPSPSIGGVVTSSSSESRAGVSPMRPSTPLGDTSESHVPFTFFLRTSASIVAWNRSRWRSASSSCTLQRLSSSSTCSARSLSCSISAAAATISTFSDSYLVCCPRRMARVRCFMSRSSSMAMTRASSAPVARLWQMRAHWSIASLSLSAVASSFSSAMMRARAAWPLATSIWQRMRSVFEIIL